MIRKLSLIRLYIRFSNGNWPIFDSVTVKTMQKGELFEIQCIRPICEIFGPGPRGQDAPLTPPYHRDYNNGELDRSFVDFTCSDVKRGQNLEAETEAKDKVMNKKYQMMVDNIQANLYHYDQNDTV